MVHMKSIAKKLLTFYLSLNPSHVGMSLPFVWPFMCCQESTRSLTLVFEGGG